MWIAFFDVEGIANCWYIAVGPAVDQYFYKYTLEYLEEKVYAKALEVWSHQWVLNYSIAPSHLLLPVTQFLSLKEITTMEHPSSLWDLFIWVSSVSKTKKLLERDPFS